MLYSFWWQKWNYESYEMIETLLQEWREKVRNPIRAHGYSAEAAGKHATELINEALNASDEERLIKTHSLVKAYCNAVSRTFNTKRITSFYENGFPINFKLPASGGTVLHEAAACRARPFIKEFLKKSDEDYMKDLDYLTFDRRGYLPSDNAFLYGEDPALSRLFWKKQRQQAEKQGVSFAINKGKILLVPKV